MCGQNQSSLEPQRIMLVLFNNHKSTINEPIIVNKHITSRSILCFVRHLLPQCLPRDIKPVKKPRFERGSCFQNDMNPGDMKPDLNPFENLYVWDGVQGGASCWKELISQCQAEVLACVSGQLQPRTFSCVPQDSSTLQEFQRM